ncbi:MAG: histidinol-phosphatase [Gammaproteobacteria bacterium]
MSTDRKERELLDFAVSIAEASGRIARKYFRSASPVANKSAADFDPVTEADRNIEAFLLKKIHASYPGHGVIGEEHGSVDGNSYTWILDPIDGTRGFISGSPMWGTLVGLMKDSVPLIGVMHQPIVRETFFADKKGTWLKRGKSIASVSTRSVSALEQAVLYCTHPSMFKQKADRLAFAKVESHCQYSRFGADCYGYCLLAAGFVDLVIEADLQAYDILPLIPLIESAGGIITDWEGNFPDTGGKVIAAANRRLHRSAIELLNSQVLNGGQI